MGSTIMQTWFTLFLRLSFNLILARFQRDDMYPVALPCMLSCMTTSESSSYAYSVRDTNALFLPLVYLLVPVLTSCFTSRLTVYAHLQDDLTDELLLLLGARHENALFLPLVYPVFTSCVPCFNLIYPDFNLLAYPVCLLAGRPQRRAPTPTRCATRTRCWSG